MLEVVDAELLWIAEATGAEEVRRGARIQSLWSGYGEIFRVHLTGADVPTAVVKSVKPPALPPDPVAKPLPYGTSNTATGPGAF